MKKKDIKNTQIKVKEKIPRVKPSQFQVIPFGKIAGEKLELRKKEKEIW